MTKFKQQRKTDEDGECNGCINSKGENCTIDVENFDMRLTEHGTCYKAGKKIEIANNLELLACKMKSIAAEMDYYGGLSHWAARAKEMRGAAEMAAEWSRGMREEG